jgi:Fe-S cluster biogenesis protein NfuA
VSPVWIVSMVLAWVVIALLAAVVLSLLRQLGELRARLAVLDPFAPADEGVIEAPLHTAVTPFVAEAGGEPLVLGGERDEAAVLVVYEPGCAGCAGVATALAALAAEPEPGCLVVAVTDAAAPVPRIGIGDLPPPLRPETVPAVIGLTRAGVVGLAGRATSEADLRAAARACADAPVAAQR